MPKPVYHEFMDEAYKVGEKVELVTPARFLFNAGGTPKAWNKKMLADPHLKVLHYEAEGSKVFPNTDIKGGIVVTMRDSTRCANPIETYVPFPELHEVLRKVRESLRGFHRWDAWRVPYFGKLQAAIS